MGHPSAAVGLLDGKPRTRRIGSRVSVRELSENLRHTCPIRPRECGNRGSHLACAELDWRGSGRPRCERRAGAEYRFNYLGTVSVPMPCRRPSRLLAIEVGVRGRRVHRHAGVPYRPGCLAAARAVHTQEAAKDHLSHCRLEVRDVREQLRGEIQLSVSGEVPVWSHADKLPLPMLKCVPLPGLDQWSPAHSRSGEGRIGSPPGRSA